MRRREPRAPVEVDGVPGRLARFRVGDWLEPMPGEDPLGGTYPEDLTYWAQSRWRCARRAAGLPEVSPYTGEPSRYRRLRVPEDER